MRGTLYLTILKIQSSYVHEIEEPLRNSDGIPDTIQWWVAETGAWRIRTFALDHDIHTHYIGNVDNLQNLALANDRNNYGDVIQAQYTFELKDALDAEETSSRFRAAGLTSRYEIAAERFIFWSPDEAIYHTQSEPK